MRLQVALVIGVPLLLPRHHTAAIPIENRRHVRGEILEAYPFEKNLRRLSDTGHCTSQCAPDTTRCSCNNCCASNLAQPNLATSGCTNEGYKYELDAYFINPDVTGISTFTYKATYCKEPLKGTGGLSHWGIIAGSCTGGAQSSPRVLKGSPNDGKCCANSKDSCTGGVNFDNTDPTCSKDLGYRTAKCDTGFTSGAMYLTFSIKGVTGVGPAILAAKHGNECYYYCILGPSCSALGLAGVTVKCADPATTTDQSVSYTIVGGKPGGTPAKYVVTIKCADNAYTPVTEEVPSSGPWPHTKQITHCEGQLTITVQDSDGTCPPVSKIITADETPVCCHDDYKCQSLGDDNSPYTGCSDVNKPPLTKFTDVFVVNTATACHQTATLSNDPVATTGSFCATGGATNGEKTYTIVYHNDKTPLTCSQTWKVQCSALTVKDLAVQCFQKVVKGKQRAVYTIGGGKGSYAVEIKCSDPDTTTSVTQDAAGTFTTEIPYCSGTVTFAIKDANGCTAASSPQPTPKDCCVNKFGCKELNPIKTINGCDKDAGKDIVPERSFSDVFSPMESCGETDLTMQDPSDSYSTEPYNFCSGVLVKRTYTVIPHNYAGMEDPQVCFETWTVQDTEPPKFTDGPCVDKDLEDITLDCDHRTLAAPASCKATDNCKGTITVDPDCCAGPSGLHYKWTATDGCTGHDVSVSQNVAFPKEAEACSSTLS